jgi:hypothetical protein
MSANLERGSQKEKDKRFRLPDLVLLQIVSLFEAIDSTTTTYSFLCSSVERMAIGTNIYTQVFYRRAGFKCIATRRTCNSGQFISWMNSCFHFLHLFSLAPCRKIVRKKTTDVL